MKIPRKFYFSHPVNLHSDHHSWREVIAVEVIVQKAQITVSPPLDTCSQCEGTTFIYDREIGTKSSVDANMILTLDAEKTVLMAYAITDSTLTHFWKMSA